MFLNNIKSKKKEKVNASIKHSNTNLKKGKKEANAVKNKRFVIEYFKSLSIDRKIFKILTHVGQTS